jgi:hypothetical protein
VNLSFRVAALSLIAVFLSAPVCSGNSSVIDENEDGKPDQWIEELADDQFRVTKDRDFDGVSDYSLLYHGDGNKEYEELDFNFDGSMDDFYYYAAGVLDYRTVDTNYDGQIDLWVYLSEGVYVAKIERDTDHDGEVDYVKTYGQPSQGVK